MPPRKSEAEGPRGLMRYEIRRNPEPCATRPGESSGIERWPSILFPEPDGSESLDGPPQSRYTPLHGITLIAKSLVRLILCWAAAGHLHFE